MNQGSITPGNQILAIASGKGGVGKTVVTANLALDLARLLDKRNSRVVAVDLDLGCGNLNSCLGVRDSNGTINDFLLKKKTLEQVLTQTEVENLQMISGSYSGMDTLKIDADMKRSLFDSLARLRANFVLLDLGAGTSPEVLDFFLEASDRIIVVTPESLSLHNAYTFLKSAILRLLSHQLEKEDFLAPVKSKLWEIIEAKDNLNIRSLVEQFKLWDTYGAYVLSGIISDLKIRFIVNMYRGGEDKIHLLRFHKLLFKYLGLRDNLDYLGFVHFEPKVMKSVQGIKPFVLRYPNNRAAREIQDLAVRILKHETYYQQPPMHFPQSSEWLSRLLEKWRSRKQNGDT
ncbi:MAG: P-loop NTPase [Acidobacteria bacterium]|nr:P-loop NTPase [Acidobacteriota bacterium]